MTGGRFNVLLGSVNPVSASVFSEPDRYLGIKVERDAEMTPRSRLASVPYTMNAEKIGGRSTYEISGDFAASAFTKLFNGNVCQLLYSVPAGQVMYISDYYFSTVVNSLPYKIHLTTRSTCVSSSSRIATLQSPFGEIASSGSAYGLGYAIDAPQLQGKGLPFIGPMDIYIDTNDAGSSFRATLSGWIQEVPSPPAPVLSYFKTSTCQLVATLSEGQQLIINNYRVNVGSGGQLVVSFYSSSSCIGSELARLGGAIRYYSTSGTGIGYAHRQMDMNKGIVFSGPSSIYANAPAETLLAGEIR